MSLAAALALLDQEIEELQRQLDSKRPEKTAAQFYLLRAKSLGRTLLRRAEKAGLSDPVVLDAFYRAKRKDLGLEDQLEPSDAPGR